MLSDVVPNHDGWHLVLGAAFGIVRLTGLELTFLTSFLLSSVDFESNLYDYLTWSPENTCIDQSQQLRPNPSLAMPEAFGYNLI